MITNCLHGSWNRDDAILSRSVEPRSRSVYFVEEQTLSVVDLADPVFQDLQEWRGTNVFRASPDGNDVSSIALVGLFNKANKRGSVLHISQATYAKAGPELRCLIGRVLQRVLPLPFPLGDQYKSVFVGELIVEGYGQTCSLEQFEWPADAFLLDDVWLVKGAR